MDTKRIKIVKKNPNTLFKQWLRELIAEAESKKKKISKTYKKALDSLEKYPLSLYSGHDCAILEGFGPKICDILEEKMQKYLANLNDHELQNLCYKDKIQCIRERECEEYQDLIKDIEAANLIDTSITIDEQSKKLEMSVIEEQNDEECDIMICNDDKLSYEIPNQEKENKINTQNTTQNISESSDDSLDRLLRKYNSKTADERKKQKRILKMPTSSFDSPKTTSIEMKVDKRLKKFKSFNSIDNLAGPSFTSSPVSRICSTAINTIQKVQYHNENEEDEFDKLVSKYDDKSNEILPSPIAPIKRKIVTEKSIKSLPTLPIINPILVTVGNEKDEGTDKFDFISVDDIDPHEFEIQLLIDIGESKASSKSIQEILRDYKVKSDVRKLHVGDFLWIAKHKTNKSHELVLPYIVERKRLDDLSSSIKDGRFHEQKFRLRHCGLQHVIYLIENYMRAGKVQCSLPFNTLLQAAANTQIQNKFTVKFTESCEHSGVYLAVMTSFIDNIFKNKKPIKYSLLEFSNFNQCSVKQKRLSVRETFIKQLLTLKGLSVDIALEIAKFYPTPSHLYEEYLKLSESEGEMLLSKITIGDLKRKIPTPVSKVIYHFYMYKLSK